MLCYICEFHIHNTSSFAKIIQGKRVNSGQHFCTKEGFQKIKRRELSQLGRPYWCPLDPCSTTCMVCGQPVRSDGDTPLCSKCKKL